MDWNQNCSVYTQVYLIQCVDQTEKRTEMIIYRSGYCVNVKYTALVSDVS